MNIYATTKHKTILLCLILFLSLGLFSKHLTLVTLDFYDHYITPYNGECAYRVMTKKESCSEFFRNQVSSQGLLSALIAMPQQFQRCQNAYHHLQLHAEQDSIPACCAAGACCAAISLTPIPVGDDQSPNSINHINIIK